MSNDSASFDAALVHETQNEVKLTKQFFPDDNFRNAISQLTHVQPSEVLSQSVLDSITRMDFSKKSISSVQGIGYFKNLTELDLSYNKLSQVDLSTIGFSNNKT